MISIKTFKALALSYPGTAEKPHFEKTSFRVKNKIFATLTEEKSLAVIKLSEVDQSVFCSIEKSTIYPVDNKWGKQGWTVIDLKKIKKDILIDALTTAYNEVVKNKRKPNDRL